MIEDSSARKFLDALDEAAYERDDRRRFISRRREAPGLHDRIELVVIIRMASVDVLEREEARNVAGRRLEDLHGYLSEQEIASCYTYYMNSLVWMSEEKRAEYDGLKHEQEESNQKKSQEEEQGQTQHEGQ